MYWLQENITCCIVSYSARSTHHPFQILSTTFWQTAAEWHNRCPIILLYIFIATKCHWKVWMNCNSFTLSEFNLQINAPPSQIVGNGIFLSVFFLVMSLHEWFSHQTVILLYIFIILCYCATLLSVSWKGCNTVRRPASKDPLTHQTVHCIA